MVAALKNAEFIVHRVHGVIQFKEQTALGAVALVVIDSSFSILAIFISSLLLVMWTRSGTNASKTCEIIFED